MTMGYIGPKKNPTSEKQMALATMERVNQMMISRAMAASELESEDCPLQTKLRRVGLNRH
jgi:hypothetical protein